MQCYSTIYMLCSGMLVQRPLRQIVMVLEQNALLLCIKCDSLMISSQALVKPSPIAAVGAASSDPFRDVSPTPAASSIPVASPLDWCPSFPGTSSQQEHAPVSIPVPDLGGWSIKASALPCLSRRSPTPAEHALSPSSNSRCGSPRQLPSLQRHSHRPSYPDPPSSPLPPDHTHSHSHTHTHEQYELEDLPLLAKPALSSLAHARSSSCLSDGALQQPSTPATLRQGRARPPRSWRNPRDVAALLLWDLILPMEKSPWDLYIVLLLLWVCFGSPLIICFGLQVGAAQGWGMRKECSVRC